MSPNTEKMKVGYRKAIEDQMNETYIYQQGRLSLWSCDAI